MPPNQRKIIGPESSVSWRLYIDPSAEKDTKKSTQKKSKKIDRDSKKEIYIKVGVLTHVKGSAYLEAGQTKILTAVHPPRESSKQNKKTALGCINCELKYDRCASPNVNKIVIAKTEKYLSISLRKALEPAVCLMEFPNFQIDIVVHVIEDSGCVLSSAINCAGAALMDGGVPMFDMIVASTAFVQSGTILLNPICEDNEKATKNRNTNENDSNAEEGSVVLAQLPTCNQISECFQKGYISFNLLKDVHKKLSNQNQHIAKVVKQVLVKKVKESLEKPVK